MEAAFGKANLSGYTIEGSRIHVPHGQQPAYMAAAADAKALPNDFGSYIRRALDESTVIELPKQHEARIRTAIQEELAHAIRAMPGIESAEVIFDADVQPGLSQERVETASVLVKPLGSAQLDAERISSIRYLVAGAFAGLRPANVTVADLNGRVSHGDPDSDGLSSENLYLSVKKMHEDALKAKIQNALSYIPGVTVEPTFVLDPQKHSHTYSIENKPKPVARMVKETSSTKTQDGTSGGGRPGAGAQGNQPMAVNGTAAVVSGKGTHEEEENTQREEVNDISQERKETESVGLTPKQVRVSVGLPSSYVERVWREQNPPKDGEKPKTPDAAALTSIRDEVSTNVRKQVAGLLPPLDGVSDPTEMVTVTTFQDFKRDDLPAPSIVSKLVEWLNMNWSTLGIGGLVLASLAMLRSMMGSTGAATSAGPVALRAAGSEAEPQSEEPPEIVVARRLRRMSGGGPSLRDELSDLVKEDPDAAANILRSWIGPTN
jgi:flagellar M-ring protein FliF